MTKRFALLVLLVGCGTVDVPVDDPVLVDLWGDIYGAPGPVPFVSWDEIECWQDWAPGLIIEGECWFGATYSAVFIRLPRLEGQPWADTMLAHELVHAARRARGLEGDREHVGPEWARGGLVDQGVAWLRRNATRN